MMKYRLKDHKGMAKCIILTVPFLLDNSNLELLQEKGFLLKRMDLFIVEKLKIMKEMIKKAIFGHKIMNIKEML